MSDNLRTAGGSARGRPRAFPRSPARLRASAGPRAVAGVSALAALAALAALPYVDLAGPVPLLQALAPIGGVILAAAGLLATALAIRRARRRSGLARPAVAALACLGAGGAMLWPVLAPAVPAGSAEAGNGATGTGSHASLPADAAGLSVLSLNTEYGHADPASIIEQVRARRVDLLILVEETPQHWAALQEAGLNALLPHATGTLGTDAGGSLIVSAHPLACPDSPAGGCAVRPRGAAGGSGTFFDQPVAALPDGTLVRAAHPWPPRPDPSRWRVEQEEMGRWLHEHAGRPLVVAGDFNAGPVHPVFRAITAGVDRSPSHGVPWVRTWPMSVSGLGAVPPFVQIDHVLATGRVATDAGVVAVPGTDHAAVWSRLDPPG